MAPNLKEEMKQKRIAGLLRSEALEALKKNRFTGTLYIRWEEGNVRSFNLRTEINFNASETEGDDFVHFFGSF